MPLRSKENVSLFSKISLRSFLHMCETKIIHSIRDRERERDTSCLASSSFEREEGRIIDSHVFCARVKKEAMIDEMMAKNRAQYT